MNPFLKYGDSWQKYCPTNAKQMPHSHFAPFVITQVALWPYKEKWKNSTIVWPFLCTWEQMQLIGTCTLAVDILYNYIFSNAKRQMST